MVPKNSAWVWDQLGLPPETQRQLKAELAQQRMSELSATGQGVTSQAVELARMNRQSGSSDSAE
jgi:hypothetical protein